MADFSVDDTYWTSFLQRFETGESYSAARSAGDASAVLAAGNRFVLQGKYATNRYQMRRKGLYFDLSTLTSNVINSAELKQEITFPTEARDIRLISIESLNDPPAIADYGLIGDESTDCGTLEVGDMVQSAVNTWTLNQTGLDHIADKRGTWCYFCMRTIDDITGTEPSETYEGINLADPNPTYGHSTLEINYTSYASIVPVEAIIRVGAIRHIYRPGLFRMVLSLGDVSGTIETAVHTVRRELAIPEQPEPKLPTPPREPTPPPEPEPEPKRRRIWPGLAGTGIMIGEERGEQARERWRAITPWKEERGETFGGEFMKRIRAIGRFFERKAGGR